LLLWILQYHDRLLLISIQCVTMQYVHWRDRLHLNYHGVMRDTEFSRQCCRGFRYTGMSQCVAGQMVPSIL